MTEYHCEVAIVGAGCAGLTAGLYCSRAELKPIIFAGNAENRGGMLSKTSIVENYPGFPDGIDGSELIMNMEAQAEKYGATIIGRNIMSIDAVGDSFKLIDDTKQVYICKSVIMATGSTPNKLGLSNENQFWGFGVSSCAICDGGLYKGKRIIVVGGGDTACEEALFLTKFSNVTMILRRDTFRASPIMQQRVLDNPKIKLIFNTQITKLIGSNKSLEFIEIIDNTGSTNTLPVDGLFYGLGLTPNIDLVKHIVETDGVIKKVYRSMTSVKGMFVAGDANDDIYRQAVVAAGHGCMAALDVIAYLDTK